MSGPAWIVINDLFEKHGLAPPPGALRDQLVMHLIGYRRHFADEARSVQQAASAAANPNLRDFPKGEPE